MTQLTCHHAYEHALTLRTQYPPKSGKDTLTEVHRTMQRRYEGLNLIESSIDEEIPFPPGFDIRGWTVDDWPYELCKLPMKIAEDLGSCVLPAIRVMCADPNAPTDLKNYLADIDRRVEICVDQCEKHRKEIEKPTKQRAATLKRISEAEGLLRSVLMLIDDTFACAGLPAPNMDVA